MLLGLTLPASAGIFSIFKRDKTTPAPAPVPRVPELVQILRSDANDGKRASAAVELRQYDPKAYPEIVPALLEALQRDAKPEVRSEAAESLGRLRPVTPEVGQALEHAAAADAAPRVRSQAQAALKQYQKSGYRPTARIDGPALTPPSGTARTVEPPLADQPATPAPAPRQTPAVARPMPSAPPRPPLVPADAPRLEPAPPPLESNGPALTPP
jgi:hypothetical protein